MSTLLTAVSDAAERRTASEQAFRAALRAARAEHSWSELAQAAGLSRAGVRHLVMNDRKGADRA